MKQNIFDVLQHSLQNSRGRKMILKMIGDNYGMLIRLSLNSPKKLDDRRSGESEALLGSQNQESKILVQNKLINQMIEEGILSKDGKRPLKSLDSVAFFLVVKMQIPTVATLKDMELTKRNGDPYSERAYKKAIYTANTR